MRLTDVVKTGDWIIHQTKYGNWVVAQVTKVEDNGDIFTALAKCDGFEDGRVFRTLKAAVGWAESRGLRRTWKIGYHRWKLEDKFSSGGKE